MDTKALRQKILDLAIRGKLVPQDPNDEPAEVLLERIREQKQQMFKEGKLKKKDIKNDTIIFKGEDNLHYEKFQDGTVKCIEDEIPFEVPEGWSWCRLRDLLNVCSSKRVLQSDWKNEGIPFYRAREIVKLSENDFVENDLFISKEHYLELEKNYGIPQSGDLMVSGVGTIGKVYIVKPEDQFYYKDASVLCFENRNKMLVSKFAKILLESSFVQLQMRENSKGTTVDTITISAAMNYLCIVPPQNEQVRIVAAVQQAIVKVNEIQFNKDNLHSTITILKSKILDLAIRGKLVPQDPNDEPASVLLERIRAEKEELIKHGKIKRDKKESVIFKGDDNSYYEKVGNNVNCIDEKIPFELPEGWAFIRLNTAWELISGRDLSPSEYNDKNDGIPYITGASNFKNGHISLVRWTPVPQVITRRGDLLLTCKGTIGEIAHNNFGEAHIARQIMAIRNIYSLNVDFLALCIEYSMTKIKQAAKGLIPGISREDILNLVIPIPPTKEQENICNKLKVTFSAIEHIEKSLN
jgi:restriction endonuclease S subunit